MSDFDLNDHLAHLLMEEPFFAAISRSLDKRVDTSIPTAGVRLNRDRARFELVYNPEWFEQCIDLREGKADAFRYVRGTIIHELWHIVLGHVSHRLPATGMSKVWNIATDLAINSHLMDAAGGGDHHLPPGCLFPGEGPFADMPRGLAAEGYLSLLQQQQQQQEQEQQDGEQQDGEQQQDGQGGEGGEGGQQDQPGDGGQQAGGDPAPHGDHDGWEESADDSSAESQMAREVAEERLREAIEEAANEADSKGHGWGSARCNRDIIRERVRRKVNWRAILRSFVKATVKADKFSTVRRPNRRIPGLPGRRVNRAASIAVSIDQSGSVSDAMLRAFYAELATLSKIVTFTVVPFDDTVFEDGVHVWKKGARFEAKRYRYGGTDFNAPTRWVNERGFDGHIILTDMCAPKPVPSRVKRMWMTDRDGLSYQPFTTHERVIVIED